MQEVPHDEGRPGARIRSPAAQPAAHGGEVRTAGTVEDDDLAIQQHGTPAERVADHLELGKVGGAVMARAGAKRPAAVVDAQLAADAVEPHLQLPVVASRRRPGGAQHRCEKAR
jgi:hypothetical protein